ncbi:MAG: folylpolyglutamate synthase/dihydrofolate synthase family protein, partial [Actinomyces sp.]|nr:folylpolyglutamate synthase/dihydrofolate synthase family protein [Actinomyces sp.]
MAGESFFTHDPNEETRAARAEDDTQLHGTIPADLIPYLEEADRVDDEDLVGDDQQEEVSERDLALEALALNSMLLGPDPSIVAELEGDYSQWGEDWEEELAERRAEDAHREALDDAAHTAAVLERVEEIYQQIIARVPEHQVQPTLDRVTETLDILGDPQNSYPSVHITGTNGKTSTTRMIDALLGAFGVRTGRFTSPHLVDVRERITIEGDSISPDEFVRTWEDIAPYIEMVDRAHAETDGTKLSFFEVFTVMAFAAFADHPVDAAVVEVGMGGRWDATNVIDAGVGVIMPIAIDHEKWLGSTIREIAEEKAGIIKPGQIVIVAKQQEEALRVIEERAAQVDAIVRLEGRDYEVLDRQLGVGGQMITVRTPAAVYEDVFVPLFGDYQASNAAAAIAAVEAFMGGRALDAKVVEAGMLSATSPGRLQVVRHSPTIIVDAAHNPAGAHTLGESISEAFDFERVVGVYSAMGDKDIEGVLGEVEPYLDSIVITQMPGPRAKPAEEIAQIAREVFGADRVDVQEDILEAIATAVNLGESGDESAPA